MIENRSLKLQSPIEKKEKKRVFEGEGEMDTRM
jgi:hypothetical protein